jgi:hypothetical protein
LSVLCLIFPPFATVIDPSINDGNPISFASVHPANKQEFFHLVQAKPFSGSVIYGLSTDSKTRKINNIIFCDYGIIVAESLSHSIDSRFLWPS